MAKILIIGQAPPAVKQTVPYDTTLLYEVLSWVGITKDEAQNLFDFDALIDYFPGYNSNGTGHAIPHVHAIDKHYNAVLREKINNSNGVIVLGKVAEDYIKNKVRYLNHGSQTFIFLPHPSKRNYAGIMGRKAYITSRLGQFITNAKSSPKKLGTDTQTN